MACMVMAYILMSCIVIACIVMLYIGTAYIVMACTAMAGAAAGKGHARRLQLSVLKLGDYCAGFCFFFEAITT